MTSLDTTLTARVSAYKRDPKRKSQVEKIHRVKDISNIFCNTMFQDVAMKGQNVQVVNEPYAEVVGTNGYDDVTVQNLKGSVQNFTIEQAAHFDVRIFDVDRIQSEDDLASLYLNRQMEEQARYMSRSTMSSIKDNAFLNVAEVDISDGNFSSTNGDSIFGAIFDAQHSLDTQGYERTDRKAVIPFLAKQFLAKSSFIQNNTEYASNVTQMGFAGTLDGAALHQAVDVPREFKDYTVVTDGAVAGTDNAKYITVTSATTAPFIQDTFVFNSKSYRVLAVRKEDAANSFTLQLDRAIEDDIADATSLSVTGYTHEYLVLAEGNPVSKVVQSNFGLTTFTDPTKLAERLRGVTLFDHFITDEAKRQIVTIKVKIRNY
jgi:hypothetical protein